MGIPSYYKKLIDTVPGLVSKGYPDGTISWLFMDFNCLIYHCLYREDTPAYTGDTETWEAQLLDCVERYCLKVIKQVKPTKGVYIAVDGVVPMAKMRQQRFRRFKSAWLQSHSPKDNETCVATWDKNAITPGTTFMKKLRVKLETMISKHGKKTWKLSSSDEPGEGEHKIMREWRKGTYKGNFAVYGLDADLIILSILTRETCSLANHVWLFREEVQAGSITYDSMGEEEFEWFSIHSLRDWLGLEWKHDEVLQRQFLLNYCFAMSVLGNDFLPTSLGLKIREDGHGELFDILKQLISKGISCIHLDTSSVSYEGLHELFTILSHDEEHRIAKYVCKKMNMSAHILSGQTDPPTLDDSNWPLYHIEEKVLVESKQLTKNWQANYVTHFFPGFSFESSDLERICHEYLYGIQWIWAYYTGKQEDVCFNWYYPFSVPPLWKWISQHMIKEKALPAFPKEVLLSAEMIRPVEQLALVLPLSSWSLVPAGQERKLPYVAPYLFPESFGFDSIGKRYFWECESMIPLPSIQTLKHIIQSNTLFAT
jgi:5'-3' exonuclease